jgi:hypothetical protein
MYYPVSSRITALTTVRRERLLPAPGQVLVSPGEMVGPADVVARCQLPGEIRVLDVCRILGIPRARVAKYVRKSVGDMVQANELLASPRGPLGQIRRGCRSPVDGEVIEIRDGLILIESATTTFELRAHFRGEVTNVMPNRGVVVSVSGALIQAMWGSGGEAEGVLKMLVDNPQKPLRARAIDVSCHGTIVVGGRIFERDVLEQAGEARVRGIIAGGMDAELCQDLNSLPFPVLLTEGFGALPMSQPVFALLQSTMGREALLSADTRTRRDARRPEVLIPMRNGHEPLEEEGTGILPMEVGARVRALRAPHLGDVGQVIDLPPRPQVVESGARLPVAVVQIDDGETVSIPVVNLELIR